MILIVAITSGHIVVVVGVVTAKVLILERRPITAATTIVFAAVRAAPCFRIIAPVIGAKKEIK